ncbi:hypothetical protein OROGR_028851 [Orobanche gracilis]
MGSSLSQQSAVDTISQWRAKPTHELIFDSGRREVSQYFEAVDRLHQSSNPKGFNNELISIAMARLKHEFASVLRRQADHQAGGPISTTESSFVTDSTAYLFRYEEYVAYETPNSDVIDYLRNIAQRMSSNGNLGECIQVYKSVRKSFFLQPQLKRLRFEDLSLGFNSRRYIWDDLRLKMELWVQVCKICVKILFEREKKLSDLIFQGLGDNNYNNIINNKNNNNNSARDECFVGTVEETAYALFNFAEAVGLSSQPYDRMESMLGIYNAFVWVLPNVNALFISELGKGIRVKCSEILSMIESDVVRMLHDFENAVLHEISNSSDDRGAIRQSTVYVMDRIGIIVKNKDLLVNLIKSDPSLNFGDVVVPQEALGDTNGRGFLDLHVILIVEVLQMNLDAKCRVYQNPSLGQLFMMNNISHISRKIYEGSDGLRQMIGDSYMRKLNENLRFAVDNYEVFTCAKFLACFDDRGLYTAHCFRTRLSRTAVRRRVKEFVALYEEFRFFHSFWTVPDPVLREEVRVSLYDHLAPAYVEFLDKLRNDPHMKLLLEKNVKYSAEDFGKLILENIFAESEVIG